MKYIRIYIRFLFMNIREEREFRGDLFLRVISMLGWFVVNILFYDLVFRHVNEIDGWTKEECIMLVCFTQFIFSIYNAIFGGNLLALPRHVLKGSLDDLILKPVSTLFLICTEKFSAVSIISSVFPVYVLYRIYHSGDPGVFLLFSLIVMIIISIAITVLLFLNISLLSLRFTSVGSLYALVMSVMQMAKFPGSIFSGKIRYVFLSVIPVIIIANFPAGILTMKGDATQLFTVSGSLLFVLFCITLLNYRLNMRKYHSVA